MAGATPTSGHAYGTYNSLDTLKKITNQSVLQFGEQRIFEAITATLAFHNAQLNEALNLFVEPTQDRARAVGSATSMEMDEIDEYGTPDAQKMGLVSDNLGFPLRKYGSAVQWNRTYFENATPAELAATAAQMVDADRRLIYRLIRRALFNPNNKTFLDRLVDHYNLSVKALCNADSFPIPPGPNNEQFTSSTHTHYLAISGASSGGGWLDTASTAPATKLTDLIAHVFEHYQNGSLLLFINAAQEQRIRQMTTNFYPYTDARVAYQPAIYKTESDGTATASMARGTLDVFSPYNRPIGIFNQAEVWVKPWVPANYVFCWNPSAPKPLAYRTRRENSGDFRLVFDDENHPLRARVFERECGLAVQERTNGAVLYIGSSSYTWDDATIV